ncbi:MBL fold metallo-hydrolase [Thermaurantiacus sp.]
MRVVMLGCGTSSGVPRIGGSWGRCDPGEPRNRRRRVSILVEQGGSRILIDTSPDLREQLLDARVSWLSAVFYTHDHADHSHGIDDLRGLFHLMRRRIDCYMDPATHDTLTRRFSYVFHQEGDYPPSARAHLLAAEHRLGDLVVRPFTQWHGPVTSTGYRVEAGGFAMAYSTDVSGFPAESHGCLEGLDLWVVDALRREPHPTHSHLAQTLGWIAAFQPRLAILTHMDQSMDYRELLEELPSGVIPGHDGLVWLDGQLQESG